MLRGLVGTWPGRALIGALAAIVIGGPILIGRVTAAPAPPEVRTAPVSRGTVTQAVTVSGSVNAGGTLRLNFQASGRVADILVKVGDRVTQGQVLARLDSATLESALAQAQANLASAQARYEQTVAGTASEDVVAARLSVENAQRALDQARRTGDTDIATAKQTLARLTTTYGSARAHFELLSTQVRTDAELLATAAADLQRMHTDALAYANALPGTAEAKSVQASLNSVTTAYTTAANTASTVLRDARTEYGGATGAVLTAVTVFDAALAAGGGTNAAVTVYQFGQLSYQTATGRLIAAMDAVNGDLTSTQSAINASLTTLGTATARGVSDYETVRTLLRALSERLITTQQLVVAAKSRSGQATTQLATVTDAVTTGLVNATQAVPAAQDKAANAIANAEASLASAQNSYAKLTASPKPADVASAYASVLSAQASLTSAETALANATLRAPAAGVVATLTGQIGENASGTTANPFLSIANTTTLALHGTIGEAEVAKLRLGQVATIAVDAIGAGTRLTGKVTLIDPVATIQQGVPVYGVDVTIDVPDPQVRPGMSGTASVILASRTGVLTVPNLAIRTTGGRRGVQVLRNGEAVDAEVVFGLATDSVTEVVSGLQEGDLVVLPQARASTTTQTGGGQRIPGPGGVPQLR